MKVNSGLKTAYAPLCNLFNASQHDINSIFTIIIAMFIFPLLPSFLILNVKDVRNFVS